MNWGPMRHAFYLSLLHIGYKWYTTSSRQEIRRPAYNRDIKLYIYCLFKTLMHNTWNTNKYIYIYRLWHYALMKKPVINNIPDTVRRARLKLQLATANWCWPGNRSELQRRMMNLDGACSTAASCPGPQFQSSNSHQLRLQSPLPVTHKVQTQQTRQSLTNAAWANPTDSVCQKQRARLFIKIYLARNWKRPTVFFENRRRKPSRKPVRKTSFRSNSLRFGRFGRFEFGFDSFRFGFGFAFRFGFQVRRTWTNLKFFFTGSANFEPEGSGSPNPVT